jgi:hypothetical protein
MNESDETKQLAECLGGPMDGQFAYVYGRASTVRFPRVGGGHYTYDVVRRKDGTIFLDWEFSPDS